MKKTLATLFLLTCLGSSSAYADNALILQTDFSLKDGAVSAMKGVAFGVDHNLKIFDLTHEIPPYNIWEGAYRLYQTASYWPQGSVFVSVVDPGVGTDRKSVVLKTKNGQYFVSPDNGTLTLVAQTLGIDSVREIDEKANRLHAWMGASQPEQGLVNRNAPWPGNRSVVLQRPNVWEGIEMLST